MPRQRTLHNVLQNYNSNRFDKILKGINKNHLDSKTQKYSYSSSQIGSTSSLPFSMWYKILLERNQSSKPSSAFLTSLLPVIPHHAPPGSLSIHVYHEDQQYNSAICSFAKNTLSLKKRNLYGG